MSLLFMAVMSMGITSLVGGVVTPYLSFMDLSRVKA